MNHFRKPVNISAVKRTGKNSVQTTFLKTFSIQIGRLFPYKKVIAKYEVRK